MRLNILISFFLFSSCLAFAAEEEDFSIYMSQSRTASELAEAAQGMVNGVRIKSLSDKIVVYGSKAGRAAALKLMKELDAPARMYRVHVRAVGKGQRERAARAIEGGVGTDSFSVGKGRSGVLRGGGGTISVGGISATAESESMETSSKGEQTITVIDGGTATISESAGFFPTAVNVTMRSQGNKGAHLKLAQQAARGARVQNLSTEIDLKLGEWRTVGGLQQQNTGSNSEILGSSQRASNSNQDIQVMVELDR